ncbi:MAG: type III-A CRISPR-associated protein Csm2 [Acidobacteriota bacterium]|nr:type III-A CRISPR-associated protein Csm2 [Blastocatellia bacterium]MDW8238330.1 type III-A CRISPR-associated protein Csm2 [Acidobacteriota bacterium]
MPRESREHRTSQQHQSGSRSAPQGEQLSQQQVQELIRQGGRLLVEAAESLGPRLQRGNLTTNQIRNIYGTVKQMEMRGFDANEFVLLKPKLAYAAARANSNGARELKDVLSWAIDEVGNDETKFARFVDFFEAVLAYHKAAGGR